MFEVVDDINSASVFFNSGICQSTIDYIASKTKLVYTLKFVTHNNLNVLEVYENKQFKGFAKVDYFKSTPNSVTIDGEWSEVEKNCCNQIETDI